MCRVQESGGHVAGGGVSVYYSHTLQILFFSYTQGKTFAASLPKAMDELSTVFPITFKRCVALLLNCCWCYFIYM